MIIKYFHYCILYFACFSILSCNNIDPNKNINAEKISVKSVEIEESDTFIITNDAVGPIQLGMKINEIYSLFSKDKGYVLDIYKGTPDSDDMPFINISILNAGKTKLLFSIVPDDTWNFVKAVSVYSPIYRTSSGIGPGITIKALMEVCIDCNELQLSGMTEEEYFVPKSFNRGKSNFIIYVDEMNESGMALGSYEEDTQSTRNFRKDGFVSSVGIGLPLN